MNLSAKSIEKDSSNLMAILCEGNRINQAIFMQYNTGHEKSWLTIDGIYLLFEYVHMLKNIRNMWLTEKRKKLLSKEMELTRRKMTIDRASSSNGLKIYGADHNVCERHCLSRFQKKFQNGGQY